MEVVQNATTNPATAAANERSRHSVSTCRASLAPLAPSAERMESSAARSAVRAIRRFATLVHAINRTSTTLAMSISEPFFAGPASPSRSEISLGRGLALAAFPRFGERRSTSASNAARACGHAMPGLSRTTVSHPLLPAENTAGFHRTRSEEHTSELQSLRHLVCRLLLEKKQTQ